MRRVQRGWRVAAVLGLWVCACYSDESSPPIDTGPGFVGGFPGVPISNPPTFCPEIGSGGTFIIVAGKAGSGAAPGVGAATGSGGTTENGGSGGAEPKRGGTSGRGDAGDGSLAPCPSEPPIAEQHQTCEGPGVCPYPDGTSCRCEACADGWCWTCNVAQLPFGCPRLPPQNGQSCPWTGVLCNYNACGPWGTTTLAGCCLGEWRVAVTTCSF